MATTDRAYLEEKLARFDPDFQITVGFAAPGHRDALTAIHALRSEFRDLLLTVRDPGVALAKLGWWQEECLRWSREEPRHPVTRALLGVSLQPGGDLTDCLAALAALVEGEAGDGVDGWWQMAERLARPLAGMEARAQDRDEDLLGCWRDIQFATLALDLPTLWRRGRPLVPLDLAARLQIDRSRLAEDPSIGLPVLQALGAQAPSTRASTRSHAGLYRELAVARLKALATAKWTASGPGGQPGPLRRLLLVWRAARRQRRLGS